MNTKEKATEIIKLADLGDYSEYSRHTFTGGLILDCREVAKAYLNLINKLEAIEVEYSPITGTFDNIEALFKHLAELEEKKLVQCPNCDEQFFVDEDGGIDAFIGA